jgi:pyridoxine kinase
MGRQRLFRTRIVIVILSSLVAASPVGGGMQAAVLARMGFETALAPTVLFGRQPGLGPPGGGATPLDLFEGMLAGIEASGAVPTARAVIAGYFDSPQQVEAAARFIDRAKAGNPSAWIVVDPILGDDASGLYVSEEVADAIVKQLVPRADLITPNAWELARIAGLPAGDASAALAAARSLGRPVLVSSVDTGDGVAVLYANAENAWLASHARATGDPKGAGDRLTALFVGHVLAGADIAAALRESTAEVAAFATGGPVDVAVSRL